MLPVEQILALTGASSMEVEERVQSLWSGYGEIVRVSLDHRPAIVKHVVPPQTGSHPRGWNTNRSHQRKLRSYDVEHAWYRDWSHQCARASRVPSVLATTALRDGGWLFVLEDLDAAGFSRRHQRLGGDGVAVCLNWLAEFHATFLHAEPAGLWETGTYWHLETRPDELRKVADRELRNIAASLDDELSSANFQTLVHGDAKVANFCFSQDSSAVAAVDFQYVGGGCGMKDVAYLLGSCLDESQCERDEAHYLDVYFQALRAAVAQHHPGVDAAALEQEWRGLFPVAWTDFFRFLAGWSPGHAKMNSYSRRLAREVIAARREAR